MTFPWEGFYAGVLVTTPTVDPLNMNATIVVRTTVRNEGTRPKEGRLLTRIVDRGGHYRPPFSTRSTFNADNWNRMRCGSDDGVTRWLGEMNVKGFHGYVMGEGVCVIDPRGFDLAFSGLPKGRYALKTCATHSFQYELDGPEPRTAEDVEYPSNSRCQHGCSIRAGEAKMSTDITRGNQLPDSGPGAAVIHFDAEKNGTTQVHFSDADGNRGVWLNGFELQQAR